MRNWINIVSLIHQSTGKEEKPKPQQHKLLWVEEDVGEKAFKNGRKGKDASYAGLTAWNSLRGTNVTAKVLRNNINGRPKITGEWYACWSHIVLKSLSLGTQMKGTQNDVLFWYALLGSIHSIFHGEKVVYQTHCYIEGPPMPILWSGGKRLVSCDCSSYKRW